MQEKFRGKGKKLYFDFVGLENAIDRVEVLERPCWPSVYSRHRNIRYSMTLRPYVYTNSLDSIIVLITFGCVLIVINVCMHDILILWSIIYAKLFRVRIRVKI